MPVLFMLKDKCTNDLSEAHTINHVLSIHYIMCHHNRTVIKFLLKC